MHTLEELLTTGVGVDYLVRSSEEIDGDNVIDAIKDKVLYVDRNQIFMYDEGWRTPVLNGAGASYYVIWGDNSIYLCWDSQFDNSPNNYKIEHDGDHYAALMRQYGKDAEVVAFVENVLIIQYHDDYGRFIRQIAYIEDRRDNVIETYLKDVVM